MDKSPWNLIIPFLTVPLVHDSENWIPELSGCSGLTLEKRWKE